MGGAQSAVGARLTGEVMLGEWKWIRIGGIALVLSILPTTEFDASAQPIQTPDTPYVVVLGIAQDGGHPQMGCTKKCCTSAPPHAHLRSCIALVDPESGQRWIFDATPDLPQQLRALDEIAPSPSESSQDPGLAGVFLTHAHIGHYPGLMYFGRETMGAQHVAVYALPRMKSFLENNGPWSQLVELSNIDIVPMQFETRIELATRLDVFAYQVPHRDEFSETAGFVIEGDGRRVLYLPDIDKWDKWEQSLEEVLKRVDRAYVDGTFYDASELPGRDMSEIPHPFMVETMDRLAGLPDTERSKIHFIHLNHSNPVLDPSSEASQDVTRRGFFVAQRGDVFPLY